jgi:ATP-dependent exoDNAse (exonuclease V) beta subunit
MSETSLLAPETPRFLVVRASAGSGKTYNLVHYYLSACLMHESDNYFRHILAITFTNKAADEMKQRVIVAMRELAQGEGKHIDRLVSELNLDRETVRRRADRQYRYMMTHYGQIAIMTIDKFVNRLVRNFTRELALDGDFRIELDPKNIIAKAVDNLLNRIGDDEPELTRIVERFVLQRVEDEDSWNIRTELLRFGGLLFKEEIRPVINALDDYEAADFVALHEAYRQEVAAAEAEALKAAKQAIALLESEGLMKAFSSNYVPKFFEKIIAEGVPVGPNNTVRAQFDGEKSFCAAKAPDEVKMRVEQIAPQLTQYFDIVLDTVEGPKGSVIQLKKHLTRSMYPLAVLQQLRGAILDVRAETNAFTFDDLNRTIESLVSNSPAPFIFERIGERYRHFLIDEFQDTSVVQWQNFLPLIENSLATGHFNLVVGDGKQAIYRWRNGDVRQLQQLPQLIGRELTPVMVERQQALERNHEGQTLKDNWRSREEVVYFNNTFFEHLKSSLHEDHHSIYTDHDQVVKGEPGGWVTVEAYQGENKEDLLRQRHERIHRLVLENIEHDLSLKDIAILTRSRKEGSAIARFLLDQGIHTITDESLQIGLHAAPLAVIYLMRALNDRDDQQAVVSFMQSAAAIDKRFSNLADLYEHYAVLPRAKDEKGYLRIDHVLKDLLGLEDFRALASRSLYDLTEDLIGLLAIDRSYPAYAEALLQMVLDYQRDESEGLSGFLNFWETDGYRKSISVPDSINGVRVMTVHKSKGLEFPVVISLVTENRSQGHSDLHPVTLDAELFGLPVAVAPLSKLQNTWAHDQYEEEVARQHLDELNIIYVAFTRAAEHLHVLVESGDPSKGKPALHKTVARILGEQLRQDLWSDRAATGAPVKGSLSGEETNEDLILVKEMKRTALHDRLKIGTEKEGFDPVLRRLSAREEGNEIHRLLSSIRHRDEITRLDTIEYPWQRMDKSAWQRILDKVRAVVDLPDARAWFEPEKAYLERDWMAADGSVLRPDRVVVSRGKLIVIDFKTGEPDPKHHQQVQGYMEELFKGQDLPVEGWLLYTDHLLCEQVGKH